MEGKDKKELMDLMKNLISIQSISGTENVYEAIKYIEGWLTDNAIKSEIIFCHGVPNIVARIGEKKHRKILLNSHVDVVPAGNYINWDFNPFSAYIDKEYLYGRGASDSKSGVAAIMMVMKLLKEKEKLQGELEIMITGAEESGSENGTIAMLEKFTPNYDAAIVVEPSNMCIEIGQRGLRWLEVCIHGIAGHSARPYLGLNAISEAGKVISALELLTFDNENQLFEERLQRGGVSVNKISGGIQNNIIAEDCKMVLDCRMMPGDTAENVYKKIYEAVSSSVDSRCHIEVNFLGNGWDPFILNEEEPIVRTIKEASYKVMKKKMTVRGKAGCTDASHIYNKGVPVLIFGPGNPNESHSSNERVKIDNIINTVDILMNSIEQYFEEGRQTL